MTHSEKIQYAKSDLAYHQNLLMNECGIMTTIKRIGRKRYQVVVNFAIEKEYRTRRSARRYIKKLTIEKLLK